VVVAGPRGSGRSHTLCSTLASLNRPDVNILTIEDPAQFDLPGINHMALRHGQGIQFGTALRSCLHQDVNIVAMDPIGTDDTVEEMVQLGARSGILFLATLLEEDAPSALLTLVQRSGQAADVARAVRVVVAQRLVRRICASCKVEVTDMPTRTLIDLGMNPEHVGSFKLYKGKGCGTCNGTGYKGRVGLYEVMEITEGIRDLIMVGATAVEIKRKALEEGMLTLRQSGLEKIRNGVTTVEEVLRETVL
jgi:type IV pilus assembly protein PilB